MYMMIPEYSCVYDRHGAYMYTQPQSRDAILMSNRFEEDSNLICKCDATHMCTRCASAMQPYTIGDSRIHKAPNVKLELICWNANLIPNPNCESVRRLSV